MYYNGNPVTVYGSVVATPGDAVLFTELTLTDCQKEQARENIGAASNDSVVKFDEQQNLTDMQKMQVRNNIGAAGAAAVNALEVRLLDDSLTFIDKKNNDNMLLYTEAGKLYMRNKDKNKTATFLTNDDEQRLINATLAALPIYSGEVEEV